MGQTVICVCLHCKAHHSVCRQGRTWCTFDLREKEPGGGLGLTSAMNIQSTINKEVFIPRNERMLVAVEVQRRKKKRISFFSPGTKGDYATFICVSVTNTRPHQLLISKVKQFSGSLAFTRTSQWAVEQLRQVNGINPNKDTPEFDLVFVNAVDQWVASSAAEKCILVQILYRACQTYWAGKAGSLVKAGCRVSHQDGVAGPMDSSPGPSSGTVKARRKSYVAPRPPEFINCPSKLTGDSSSMNLFLYRCKAFFNHMKKKMVANQRSPENRGISVFYGGRCHMSAEQQYNAIQWLVLMGGIGGTTAHH